MRVQTQINANRKWTCQVQIISEFAETFLHCVNSCMCWKTKLVCKCTNAQVKDVWGQHCAKS